MQNAKIYSIKHCNLIGCILFLFKSISQNFLYSKYKQSKQEHNSSNVYINLNDCGNKNNSPLLKL